MTTNSIFGGERVLDQLNYEEMMNSEIKGVKISDVMSVISKTNYVGRFFTQLGLFVKRKKWVSPDLLKNLSVNDLIQIRQICKKPIDFQGKMQEDFSEKEQKRIMQQVNVLGTAILTEVSRRELNLSDFLKDLGEISPKVLHDASPKLSALYSSYLQTVGQNQEESDLKGFSRYLIEKEAEHNFSKLEEFDIHIGRNQLIGNQKEEENWQQKMKDYLLALMTPYKDQEGAKKLFEESPEMKEAYEAFKKRSDDQRSISKFKRLNEYPFYDVFLNQIIEKRIVGSNEGKWLEGLPEQLNFCSDLYKKAFENLGIMISLKNSNIRDSERKQYQYIKVLVEDPRFQQAAKETIRKFLDNEIKDYQELYHKYALELDQLKEKYDEMILEEKGVKPPDKYKKDFASALYLAAALDLDEKELVKFENRLANLGENSSGIDEASNFLSNLETGILWSKKIGNFDPSSLEDNVN